MPIMYRCPGELRHITRGFLYDQREFADAAAAKADGWAETLEEAAGLVPLSVEPEAPADAPPTRAELEQKAAELGIKFDGRTGDKRLAALIAEKLGA